MVRQTLVQLLVIVSLNSLPAASAPVQDQQILIAVMDFYGYGISETEAAILSDRLRSELFRLPRFEVLERKLMATILSEQDFDAQDCGSEECMIEVGQLLGASQIVGGSISKVGNTFSVSARLVDVTLGTVTRVADYDHTGEMDEMLTIAIPNIAEQLSDTKEQRLDLAELEQRLKYRRTFSVSGGSMTSDGKTVYDQGGLIFSSFLNRTVLRGQSIPVKYSIIVGGGNWFYEHENYQHNFVVIMMGIVLDRRWKSVGLESSSAIGPGVVYFSKETLTDGAIVDIKDGAGISLFYSITLQLIHSAIPVIGEVRYTNDVVFKQRVVGVGVGYRW